MIFFIAGMVITLLFTLIVYSRLKNNLTIKQEEIQRSEDEKKIVVDFMRSISGAIVGEKNRQKLFQKIVHAAVINTNAFSASIFEKNENGQLVQIAVEGLFPPQSNTSIKNFKKINTRAEFIENAFRTETYSEGEGIIGSVLKSKKAIIIPEAKNDPRIYQYQDSVLQIHSLMVAPIMYDNELIAVLAVANSIDGLPFNEMDFSLLKSLSNQVGLAIQNSKIMNFQIEKNKIDLDLQLAQNIQNLILPSDFPLNKSLEFASYYSSAQKVGGDLYDVFNLRDDKIGIIIADVSGKGIPASIVMATCQTHLKHLVDKHSSPSETLIALNQLMLQTMKPGMFVTLIYGIIDLNKNQITISRAGHEAPIFFNKSSKEISPIICEGMAVGIAPSEIFDTKIKDVTLNFQKGDIFVLFTDGLTEIRNNNIEFSNSGLMNLILKNHTYNAKKIISNIITDINDYSENYNQQDDQTILLVKHT